MVQKSRPVRKKNAVDRGGMRLGREPARRGSWGLAALLVGLVLINLYVFVWRKGTSVPDVQAEAAKQGARVAEADPLAGVPTAMMAAPTPGAVAAVVPEGDLKATVLKGDSLGKILKRHGVTGAHADEVIRSLSKVLDFTTIRAGQTYVMRRASDGSVSRFELVVSKVESVIAERDPTGVLAATVVKAATRIEVEEVGATIESSLYASIKAAGENTALIGFFVDVFAYDLDFYNDTHPGDTVRVLVEKEYKDAEFLRYRRILAAEYKGKAGTFVAYHWSPGGAAGKGRYFNAAGESLEKTFLKTPLKFARVSSKFDRKRMHPILHTQRAHLGVDYAAPTGTPVWAAASGTIVQREFARGPGNVVSLKHDNGLVSVYMHLSKFASGQKVGQRVDAKTVIGFVGSTGLSTGPHLHFGVKQNGGYVDPLKLAPIRATGLGKKDLAAFKAEVSARQTRLAQVSVAPRTLVASDDDADHDDDDTAAAGEPVLGATP